MSLRDRLTRNDNPDFDRRPWPDERDAEWYRVVEQIRLMRDCPEYRWADETLAGIQSRVETNQSVTDGQRRALENIRSQEWAPSRQYDQTGRYRRWR